MFVPKAGANLKSLLIIYIFSGVSYQLTSLQPQQSINAWPSM